MKGWVARLMGRSVRDLAGEVDAALGRVALARGERDACKHALDLANGDVARAEAELTAARDALFSEHPMLAQDPSTPAAAQASLDSSTGYEIVEVDDEDDVPGGPPGGDADGPIVWVEH